MSKQNPCRICKKRPPWKYKNCPPHVCKQCYHRHIWEGQPAARKERQAQMVTDVFDDPVTDHVLLFDAFADDEALGSDC